MISEKDKQSIIEQGKDLEKVENELRQFVRGFPFSKLNRPATINDGIIVLSETQIADFVDFFEKNKNSNDIIKFVPASGAASRMFKFLFQYLEDEKLTPSVEKFISNLKKFAFYKELSNSIEQRGVSIEELIKEKKYTEIIKALLFENGLNYGSLPKAFIKFHSDNTALEAHFQEAFEYSSTGNKTNIHFTVSPEHENHFKIIAKDLKKKYEEKTTIDYTISFSNQLPETDTIAVDLNNKPFYNSDGSLLFRPAGHGALIQNLNKLDADIVFIKNIDNVQPQEKRGVTIKYKKALGGVLLRYKTLIHQYLKDLESDISEDKLEEIKDFILKELNIIVENRNQLKLILNKPIRVCGMVKNIGEPGGGPFWAEDGDGVLSLQIVEKSQIDTNDAEQKAILENSTHFNPVDLVCSIKDYKGNKFNLLDFIDSETGFISEKSKDGKTLKALELPGLWNGAMAKWITFFVEVPLDTFSPVKSVNDLLKEAHQ